MLHFIIQLYTLKKLIDTNKHIRDLWTLFNRNMEYYTVLKNTKIISKQKFLFYFNLKYYIDTNIVKLNWNYNVLETMKI